MHWTCLTLRSWNTTMSSFRKSSCRWRVENFLREFLDWGTKSLSCRTAVFLLLFERYWWLCGICNHLRAKFTDRMMRKIENSWLWVSFCPFRSLFCVLLALFWCFGFGSSSNKDSTELFSFLGLQLALYGNLRGPAETENVYRCCPLFSWLDYIHVILGCSGSEAKACVVEAMDLCMYFNFFY